MHTPGATRGRSTRRYKAMRAELRAESQRLGTPCCYCGQPIDFDCDYTRPRAFTLAHLLPVHTHPHLAEDWANVRGPAHRGCNSSAGVDNEPLGLGLVSDD